MVKKVNALFTDALVLETQTQKGKLDTNKGLDALLKRLDNERMMEFKNRGYSIKDGNNVEYFLGNSSSSTYMGINEQSFRNSMRNVVNHAITKAMQKNLASFSSSLAANNEVTLKNITCVNLDLTIDQTSQIDLLRDAVVEQKTFADISNDISSETQTLMEDVKNKTGVDLNGVVSTIGNTLSGALGIGNSNTKSKTEIYKEVSVNIADQIQNGTKDTITNDNITDFMHAARAENIAELQDVTCVTGKLDIKQKSIVNAILKTKVFAENVTQVANKIVDKFKEDTRTLDMTTGTDAVIGETLVKGIDAAGNAAVKIGEGINTASSGLFASFSTGMWVTGAVIIAVIIAAAFMFYSLMGNEALTGAVANKIKNS